MAHCYKPDCDHQPCKEEPDYSDLDPDVYCLKHGKPLLDGMYGHKASNCEDCDPGEPDYDRACEIAARRDPSHPDNVETWKLKH